MVQDNFFKRIKENLPESFWRFLIMGFIIYSFIIVGKIIYDNYQQNKMIDQQKQEIADLKNEIEELQSRIAYYKTDTFREKVARGKLRYALPGESVVAVPYDPIEENKSQADISPAILSRPNYIYWRIYFFGS